MGYKSAAQRKAVWASKKTVVKVILTVRKKEKLKEKRNNGI